jgi:hypothetical protein
MKNLALFSNPQSPRACLGPVLAALTLVVSHVAAQPGVGDCNGNGIPDDQEDQILLSESFETGLPQGWETQGLWHVTDQCAPASTCDGTTFAYYGLDGSCDFDTGATTSGSLLLPPVAVPTSALGAELVFDTATVYVNDLPMDVVSDDGIQDNWVTRSVDLSPFIGQSVNVRFTFDSVDFLFNINRGWQIDRVQLTANGVDCNGNGIPDVCDVFSGFSMDCNANGLPDECEQDCNSNGTPDDCDVTSGSSTDCDGNGIPDECEADCNANGVPDSCDLLVFTSMDCNGNGIPDECDTSSGSSADCNFNSIPDECEVAGTLLDESFEAGLPGDWTATGLWHATDQCSPVSTCEGTFHAYFGQDGTCTFDTGSSEAGILGLPSLSLQPSLLSAELSFCSAHQGESYLDVFDLAIVTVNGIPVDLVSDDPEALDWVVRTVDLGSFIGQEVDIQFEFDSRDQFNNDYLGWQIDRVQVTATSALDCNANDVTDECDIISGASQDCNLNGLPDECELDGNDCDSNGIPDDCDADCNSNGTPDACEAIADCNSNGIPDECELAGNDCNANLIPDECDPDCNTNGLPDDCEAFADCNTNGLPDECELDGNDCDLNGVPDECDTDCNGNGTPDACESFADCNSNGIPDECELAGNDCNSNGIPDECDLDCNANGIPDVCESITDCNTNGVPDECELGGNDCNSNGTPDECEPDCNSNGLPDDCEVITDCNTNGIPDECELAGNDCNANDTPDECDLASNDCNSNGLPDDCEIDCNANGIPDECETITDCNTNGIPDECELVGNDCDSNGVPDECDLDCNANGLPDACESLADCNTNGIPDECELTGNDCDSNGIPDECDPDCNGNGTPDACESFNDCNSNGTPDECDIAMGTSLDTDGNGIPDECQVSVAFCFGDGSGAPCPCGNTGMTGAGCQNSSGPGAMLNATGSNSISADDLGFVATGLIPGQSALLFSGTAQANGGLGVVLGDGLRCVGGSIRRLGVRVPDAFGNALWDPGYASSEGWMSGDTRHFQVWFRDTAGGPCLSGFNLSSGQSVTFGS